MPSYLRSSTAPTARPRALDVRADDSDARDYIFQPSLRLLPGTMDNRGLAPIRDQGFEGACVGFALATVINVSLGHAGRIRHGKSGLQPDEGVSPRMLYEMGKRHDEWHGTNYEGTSLRGGMKAWHKHGVTTERLWPYEPREGRRQIDRELTPDRARDALSRPIGAYFRILDSDVSHLQAAIAEGDAVLASAWVHDGWESERLIPAKARGHLPSIPRAPRASALHAFAIVGYTEDGFIVQNSWGAEWGVQGCALLPYDEWFDHRQDAWVARPAPTARDSKGTPKVFVVGFGGRSGGIGHAASETAAAGLEIDARAVPYLINTGDRGALSTGGGLSTRSEDLPARARLALTAPVHADGFRHIVLYAHGGLNGEGESARRAARLWQQAEQHQLAAYFFIWETGIAESVLGWFRSGDDASGPARFSFADAWEAIKKGSSKVIRGGQKAMGRSLAPMVRGVFWNEMKGRAAGASQPAGGAAQFTRALLAAMATTPNERYKLHLVGHSAGAIYLGALVEKVLASVLPGSNATLDSIDLMAPAITIARARTAFGATGLPPQKVRVHMLATRDEERDNIHIYPSSLLTYVADCLESASARVPVLGLRKDYDQAALTFATASAATTSKRHGEFDDPGHEVEEVLEDARIG